MAVIRGFVPLECSLAYIDKSMIVEIMPKSAWQIKALPDPHQRTKAKRELGGVGI